jgi:hypothetical protein
MTEEEEEALERRYCQCAEFGCGEAVCPETRIPLCAICGLWRPEWIKCVQVGYDKKPKATVDTVCGRLRVFGEFTFINWEHADVNETRGGRLLTCERCKDARNK